MSEELREAIRNRYGAAAKAAQVKAASSETGAGCCGPAGGCCGGSTSQITSGLYQIEEVGDLPPAAVLASLGCGNPTALAELIPGERVLDLGSGGGIDVLLSAKRVGPAGFVYGLDMTDEMLALARENQQKAGVANVAFLKGQIEAIPLPENAVDVIISNCVINLSTDKDQVFREAFRTLRPGGRLAVADVVFQGDTTRVPSAIRRAVESWSGCVAGALEEQNYIRRLKAAGFVDVSIQVTRVYGEDLLASCCNGEGLNGVRLVSGFVRAKKPGTDPVALRPATDDDLPAVHRLLREGSLPTAGLEEQFGPRYAVAEASGRVVGVAGLETYPEGDQPQYGLLRSVAVDSAWQGLGVGVRLVEERLDWARREGLREVWLLTTTAPAFFPRFGFGAAERSAAPTALQASREFAEACPSTAVAMRLAL